MTNDMCGIESTTMQTTTRTIVGNVAEIVGTACAGASQSWVVGIRVLPFQGGGDLFGASSQGVALGCRVVAPLARNIVARRKIIGVPAQCRANGAEAISPGQRPGNSATHNMICPERATPGCAPIPARDLEQTIAGNVAEILEA